MTGYLITGQRVVTPDGILPNAAVYVNNGTIERVFEKTATDVAREVPEGTEIIDAKDVLPGIIDAQVHFRDGTASAKATIASESRAAVAGGVTSAIHNPNNANDPGVTNAKIDEIYDIAREHSRLNFGSNMLSTGDNLQEIINADPRSIAAIKSFVGTSTGGHVTPFEAMDGIFVALRLSGKHSLPVIIHSEDNSVIAPFEQLVKGLDMYPDGTPFYVNPLIRNDMNCLSSTAKVLASRDRTGGNLHIYHLTTEIELDLLRNKYRGNPDVSTETCVHYLLFDESDYDRLGGKLKCFPAVKTARSKQALLEDVMAEDGYIRIITTDHAPHENDAKEQNDYFSVPGGLPLVQHSVVAMLDLFSEHLGEEKALELVADRMSASPAQRFSIQGRGAIREGNYADLTCVNMNNPWTVNKDNTLYKCGFSPFEGREFKPRVTHTFVNGQLAYSAEHGIDENARGQLLTFDR